MTGPTSANQRHVPSAATRLFRAAYQAVSGLLLDLMTPSAAASNDSQHSRKRERDSDSEPEEEDDPPHNPKRRRREEPCGSTSEASSSTRPFTTLGRGQPSITRPIRPQSSSQPAHRRAMESLGLGGRSLRRSNAFTEQYPWTLRGAGIRIDPPASPLREQAVSETSDSSSPSSSPSPEPQSSSSVLPLPPYSRHPESGDCIVASGPPAAPSSTSVAPATVLHEPPPPYSLSPVSANAQETGSSSVLPAVAQSGSGHGPQHSTDRMYDRFQPVEQPLAGPSSFRDAPTMVRRRAYQPPVNASGTVIDQNDPVSISEDSEMMEVGDNDNVESRNDSVATQNSHSTRRTPTRELRQRNYAARYALVHQEVQRRSRARVSMSHRRGTLTPPLMIRDPSGQAFSASIDIMARRKRSHAHAIGEDVDEEAARPATRRRDAYTPETSSPLAPHIPPESATLEREVLDSERLSLLSPSPSPSPSSPTERPELTLRRLSGRRTRSQSRSSSGSSSAVVRREESSLSGIPLHSPAEGRSHTVVHTHGQDDGSSSDHDYHSSPSPKKRSRRQ